MAASPFAGVEIVTLHSVRLNKGTLELNFSDTTAISDLNADGSVNMADVTKLINIILGREYYSKGFKRIETGKVGITFTDAEKAPQCAP